MAIGLLGNQLTRSRSNDSGLLQGTVFSQPVSRGQRRSALLNRAISSQGQNPYARLGASIGGLLGMGARAGAEGLGLIDQPREAQVADAIRKAQAAARESGIDPAKNPNEFLEVVDPFLSDFPEVAIRTRRLLGDIADEPEVEPATFYNPDTEEYVQGGYLNGVPVTSERRPLGEGFVERDYEPDASTKGKARNVRLPDGSFVRGIERPDGTLEDIEGNRLPETATVVGLSLQAGQESELPQGVQSKLNTAQLGVENYTDLVNEAIGVFNENPDVNTLAAEGSRLFRNLRTEFDSLVNASGINLAEGVTKADIFDINRYDSTFEEIGLENAALKPLYLSIALSNAQAEAQQSGKSLSDKDIQIFLRQQGSDIADPEIATEILTRNANRLQNKFKRQYKIETDSEFGEELPPIREYDPTGGSGGGQGTPAPSGGNGGNAANQAIKAGPQALVEYLQNASDEELNSLSPEVQSQIEQILSGSQ